ncbi:MAG: hypothetical protein K2N94_04030 [Lachnospiraceae bacterium]|nr:hypothetical protein [Lachnospiraceae bacterium]
MKAGKLPGAAEKRSVLKYTNADGVETARTAGRQLAEGRLVTVCDELAIEYFCQAGALLDRVLGLLAAEDAGVPALNAVVLVPESWPESGCSPDGAGSVKDFVRRLAAVFQSRGLERYAVNVRVQAVQRSYPRLMLSAGGLAAASGLPAGECAAGKEQPAAAPRALEECAAGRPEATGSSPEESAAGECKFAAGSSPGEAAAGAGCSIVMAGPAALEATQVMIEARREQLERRLAAQYLAEGFCEAGRTDVRRAVRLARNRGAVVKLPGEGGVFTALWELGEFFSCGMRLELRQILLRQETIEVCELLDLNPYLMFSGGCVLAVTGRPEELLSDYRENGIPAALLGVLTPGSDRVLVNGEEQRFLEPFREDELYRAGILKG